MSITKTDKILLVATASLFALAIYVHFVAGNATPDKEISFYSARAWLQGKKLYTDIFTVQPPLIYYIYALPVYLSIHIGILQDYHYLILIGLAVIACIIFTALKIMQFHPEFTPDKRKQTEFCLLLISVFIIFQNPSYFLDREHLFFILIFPYILRFMPSVVRARIPVYIRIITGIMAGTGFCMKPQCLIIFAGIQLVYFLRERAFAILFLENIIIYLIIAAYVASIWIFTPEYISVVVPMALATYSTSNRRFIGFLYFAGILLSLGITFADFRLRYHSPYRRDIYYLSLVALAFLGYILANNGWGYTWNLLFSMAILINGFVLWEYGYFKKEYETKGQPVRQFVFGARACIIAFAYNAVIIFLYAYSALTGSNSPFESQSGEAFIENMEIASDYHPISSFGTISIDFGTWPYLSRATGAKWDTRFNHLWMLPKFFISDAAFAAKNKWITEYVAASLAQDLEKNKPQIIFVDDTDRFYSAHVYIDLLAFLSYSAAFRQEWKHYRFARKIDSPYEIKNIRKHHGYYVYKRINQSALSITCYACLRN